MKYCHALLLSLLSSVSYCQSQIDSLRKKPLTLDAIFNETEPLDDCLILKTILNDSNFFRQFRFEQTSDSLHILDVGDFLHGCRNLNTVYNRIVYVERECAKIPSAGLLKNNTGKNYLTVRYLHEDLDKNDYVLRVWSSNRSIGCNVKFKLVLEDALYVLKDIRYDFFQY